MNIAGKERRFELNVQSHGEVSDLCPGNDLANIGQLYAHGSKEGTAATIKIAIILNRGYEDHKHFDDPDYEPSYLEEKDFRFMSIAQIQALEREISEAMQRDSQTTVEAELPKSSGKNAEEAKGEQSV